MKEDDRSYDSSSWWTEFWNSSHDQDLLMTMAAGSQALRHLWGYTHAAELLDHWLDGSGSAYKIDPMDMMDDIGGFKATVDDLVSKSFSKGGSFNSGWQSGSVANDEEKHGDTGDKVQDWWYALNGYQYRVSGSTTTVNGRTTQTVTVDVFKRYNWVDPAGGRPRNNVGPGGLVSQNDLAQLNAGGLAQDFNVLGRYSYTSGE